MPRKGIYPILLAGAIILVAGLGRPAWAGIGVAYLLAGGGVAWATKRGRSLRFTDALLLSVGVIIATTAGELIVQIRPFSPVPAYGVLSDPQTAEVLLRAALLPILVSLAFVLAVASTRRQHLVTALGGVVLVGWYLLEPIVSSMPYDSHGAITSPMTHLTQLLVSGYAVTPVGYAVLFGLPLYLLGRGLPAPLTAWLTAPTDTPHQ